MCSNYRAVTRMDRLLTFFGVEREEDDTSESDTWPLALAPFIRRAEDGSRNKVIDDGVFGMIPPFAKELAYGRRTYNARSATVDQLVTGVGAGSRLVDAIFRTAASAHTK